MNKEKLREAETKAEFLFLEIEKRGLIEAGKTETQLNEEVFALAKELYGIDKYWHKRIVRSGINTLAPYHENPPDLRLQEDDILFFDFGPIFEDWEADFGRTYVIGNDPLKLKLKNDIELAWQEGKNWFDKQLAPIGSELFNFSKELATKYGWTFGAEMAGHIIGHFPHERLEKENKGNYIHPQNNKNMLLPGLNGEPREWILEIHFVDREKGIGGFFEQLLT